MKTLKFWLIGISLMVLSTANAQVSVTLNTGKPPQWGPAGYSNVRYYYLPDVESYYDIHTSKFIYNNGVGWIHRANLPAKYRNYDLYSGYKVVMTDYSGNKPYTTYKTYKTKYAKGYRGHEQENIGEKNGKSSPQYKAMHQKPSNKKAKKHEGSKNGNSKNMKKGNGNKK